MFLDFRDKKIRMGAQNTSAQLIKQNAGDESWNAGKDIRGVRVRQRENQQRKGEER